MHRDGLRNAHESPQRGGKPRAVAPWDPRFCARSPLFWPIARRAELFATFDDWPSVADYGRALGEDVPVRFREQAPRARRRRRGDALDPSELYDARIHVSGWVPTRPRSWHDFLNMLVWAAFPRAKAELHARQHRVMAERLGAGARTLPSARTREQDGLALLDEGGLLVLGDPIWVARAAGARDALLPELLRAAVVRGDAAVLIFGHALYESLLVSGPTIYALMQPLACSGALPRSPEQQVALADAGLRDALLERTSFSRPEQCRRLPLDAGTLCGAG